MFVVSEDHYFVSHRLGLALHLRSAGWDVIVATQLNTGEHAAEIRAAGLRLVPLILKRGSLFAPSDLVYLAKLVQLYWRERPDVAHHVAMKPVLWGSIAALLFPRTAVVNALAGLGYLFTSENFLVRLVKRSVLVVFRNLFSLKKTKLILQNREDLALFTEELGILPKQIRLIRGAGIDTTRYNSIAHGWRKCPTIVMVSRMLRDKGVGELVAAARALRRAGVSTRILLVGGIDQGNPNSFSVAEMMEFQAEGVVTWLDHRSDIPAIYATADIAVLPSYREGLPKSLLEAAASGLPIVTTDTPGCREVVQDGVNGLLVPVRDSQKLAEALQTLIVDAALRERMGAMSRNFAEVEFRQEIIWKQTLAVYDELLGSRE